MDLQRSIELDRRALQIERERLTDQLKDAERRADLMEREFKQRDHQLETRAAEVRGRSGPFRGAVTMTEARLVREKFRSDARG